MSFGYFPEKVMSSANAAIKRKAHYEKRDTKHKTKYVENKIGPRAPGTAFLESSSWRASSPRPARRSRMVLPRCPRGRSSDGCRRCSACRVGKRDPS